MNFTQSIKVVPACNCVFKSQWQTVVKATSPENDGVMP